MSKWTRLARSFAVVIVLSLPVSACNDDNVFGTKNYDVREVKGQIYLLNEKTGQVWVREGNRLVELKRYAEAEITSTSSARTVPTWPVAALKFTSRIKFRNGLMYYQITVAGKRMTTPSGGTGELIDPKWKDYWDVDANWLNVVFQDEDSFSITDVMLGLKSSVLGPLPTRIVDDNNQVTAFEYDGSVPIELADFNQIKSASVRYNLEKPNQQTPKQK